MSEKIPNKLFSRLKIVCLEYPDLLYNHGWKMPSIKLSQINKNTKKTTVYYDEQVRLNHKLFSLEFLVLRVVCLNGLLSR